jgi:hypothetical protein
VVENEENKNHQYYCFGSDAQHVMFWRYAFDMASTYAQRGLPVFSVMHYSALLHDDLNTPELIDADLYAHMRRLHTEGLLNNTLLVWMADHGARFSQLRATHQVH